MRTFDSGLSLISGKVSSVHRWKTGTPGVIAEHWHRRPFVHCTRKPVVTDRHIGYVDLCCIPANSTMGRHIVLELVVYKRPTPEEPNLSETPWVASIPEITKSDDVNEFPDAELIGHCGELILLQYRRRSHGEMEKSMLCVDLDAREMKWERTVHEFMWKDFVIKDGEKQKVWKKLSRGLIANHNTGIKGTNLRMGYAVNLEIARTSRSTRMAFQMVDMQTGELTAFPFKLERSRPGTQPVAMALDPFEGGWFIVLQHIKYNEKGYVPSDFKLPTSSTSQNPPDMVLLCFRSTATGSVITETTLYCAEPATVFSTFTLEIDENFTHRKGNVSIVRFHSSFTPDLDDSSRFARGKNRYAGENQLTFDVKIVELDHGDFQIGITPVSFVAIRWVGLNAIDGIDCVKTSRFNFIIMGGRTYELVERKEERTVLQDGSLYKKFECDKDSRQDVPFKALKERYLATCEGNSDFWREDIVEERVSDFLDTVAFYDCGHITT